MPSNLKILFFLYILFLVIRNGDYIMGSHRYPQLNNKDWLVEQYIDKKISINQIAKTMGCKASNSVRQALIRFEIPLRNYREAQIVNRIDDFIINQEVIDGTLLGDASLNKHSKTSDVSAPYYIKKSKWEEYSLHIGNFLSKSKTPNITYESYELEYKYRTSHVEYTTLRTESSDLLFPFYERWYPASNNYKKVVPSDLKLTPTSILYWFLDDGSTSYRKRNYQNSWTQNVSQVRLTFCSESFTKDENEFLSQQINGFGISSRVIKSQWGSNWRIMVNQKSVNDFFDLIDECPIDCMQYKWKRSELL